MLLQAPALRKLPTKVAPTISGVTENAQASGTTHNAIVPATALLGDTGFVVLVVTDSTVITPPAGMGGVTYTPNGSGVKIGLYAGIVSGGGPGGTLAFGLSTNNASASITFTVTGTSGYSVRPHVYLSTTTEVANDRPPRFPSMKAGPQDLVVYISGAQSSLSTNLNGPLVSTPPSGMTVLESASAQNNALIVARGITLMTALGRSIQSETYDTNQASHNVGIAFALAPMSPRWADMEKVPSALGTQINFYGTSSGAHVERPEVNWGYNSRSPWPKRMTDAFGNNVQSTNYSTPGAKAADICAFIYGTATRSTEAVTGNALAVVRAGTHNPASPCKIFCADMGGNNVIGNETSAKALLGIAHAVRSFCYLVRAGTAILHNNVNVTKGGTWTTPVSNGVMGGQAAQTTVPGSTWALAVTGQAELGLVLTGGDNDATGTTGSTYRVLVDGVQVATGTTHNQMQQTNWGAGDNYRFVQMLIRVPLPNNGAHTVTVEHTGSNGHILQVQGALYPKADANLPWVVQYLLHRNTSAEAAYGYTWAGQQAIHQVIRDVAAEFTDGRVIVWDPNASGRWNPATMVASDFVHQNEEGHVVYAWEPMRMLLERVAA